MNQYPDNVIKFPVSKRPAQNKKQSKAQDNPSEVVSFLKEMLDVIDSVESKPRKAEKQNHSGVLSPVPAYDNQFLKLKPLRALDFDLFENKDTVEDSEMLDRYLVALSSEIGPEATKKLSRVIEEYVAEIADIAFAEGLTEGAIPFDE